MKDYRQTCSCQIVSHDADKLGSRIGNGGDAMRRHLVGLAIGIAAGLIDCAIFGVSGMPIGVATAISALVFWATVGWAVHVTDGQIPGLFKGVLISIFFNIPWIAEFVGNQGMRDLLLPMLASSVFFGAALGVASQSIRRRVRADAHPIEA